MSFSTWKFPLVFELLFIDLNVYVLSVRTMLTFAPVLWFVMRATDDLDVRPLVSSYQANLHT